MPLIGPLCSSLLSLSLFLSLSRTLQGERAKDESLLRDQEERVERAREEQGGRNAPASRRGTNCERGERMEL